MAQADVSKIPLCRAALGDDEEQAMLEALRSGWLAHGPFNTRFEDGFRDLLGVRHALSMNSCTSALFLAIRAHEIRGEVILPSFSFVASANAVVSAGAVPCFADIDPRTGNLDPKRVEAKISAKTEALMVVHWAGQPADMTQLSALAKKHSLLLIEDSAETLGATWDGKQAGSFGVGCFSFFPTKNITCGEGGMLTTNDDEFAARCRAYVGHGIAKDTHLRARSERPWYRDASYIGYNFRLSNVLAAIGAKQLEKLDQFNGSRRRIAAQYSDALGGLASSGAIELPFLDSRATHSYQMFTIKLSESSHRDPLVRHLNGRGVGASVHFDPPIHVQKAYRDYLADRPPYLASDLEQTKLFAASVVTLPIFPDMSEAQVARVADEIAGYFEGAR